MKTKNLRHLLFAMTLTGLFFTACKKSNSSSSNTTSDTDLQTQSDDQARVSTETDAAFDDVSTAMLSQSAVTGSSVSPTLRYGVTVDGGNQDTVKTLISNAVVTIDTIDNPHTLTINYNGKTSDGLRTRSGSIVISIAAGVQWMDAKAVVTVQFNNLKITRLLDNKSITFNGTHTYTNVSGGSLWSLTNNNATPITHTITSSNMSITFDNGTQRTWSFARQRVFSYNNGLVITESGTHVDGSATNISEWGTNRFGNSFEAQITQPLVVTESCFGQVVSGTYVLTNSAGSLTLTFGLDATGAAMASCPVNGGSFYLQLVWAGAGGKTYTFILPY